MTVAEIQEYIDKHTKGIYVKYETVDFVRLYDAMLKVRSMLDELEPKAKWLIDEYGDYHCEKCKAIIENDEWERHNNYYCYHCGARMNEEKGE